MNGVFKPFLRKFVLVFFNDVLIYSDSLQSHWQHLEAVFTTMKQHQMYLKESKCSFAQPKVEYLGHDISAEGVETDPRKIEVISKWSVPKTIKELRSFLGLTGYYRKFIPGYATISKPMADLLKKGAFSWNEQAESAFHQSKEALAQASVLALLDFSKQFIVETDASNYGIGAVLMQEGRPLAYISRSLGPKW